MKKWGEDLEGPELWRRVARTVTPYHEPAAAPEVDHRPAVTSFSGSVAAESPIRARRAFDGRVDLHGLTETEAFETLRRFLEAAQTQGWRRLLVITGKGAGGQGVLRRQVPLWLAIGAFARQVAEVEPAQERHGGAGAFYVRLKSR